MLFTTIQCYLALPLLSTLPWIPTAFALLYYPLPCIWALKLRFTIKLLLFTSQRLLTLPFCLGKTSSSPFRLFPSSFLLISHSPPRPRADILRFSLSHSPPALRQAFHSTLPLGFHTARRAPDKTFHFALEIFSFGSLLGSQPNPSSWTLILRFYLWCSLSASPFVSHPPLLHLALTLCFAL